MKKIIMLFFALLFFCAGTGSVSAESPSNGNGGFSITPFLKEIDLSDSQEDDSFLLEVENSSSFAADVHFSVADFGSLDESGGVLLLDSKTAFSNKYSLSPWIELESDTVPLEAGEKKAVKVSIINGDNLSPGGHYAAITARIENYSSENNSAGDNINLNSKLISLIFLRKIGGEIYGLNLKKVEKEHSLFSLPQKARLDFDNTGNVHVVARGIVSLIDPLGREISKGIINTESGIILPETSRVFPIALSGTASVLVPGRYKVITRYRPDTKDDFAIGEESFFFFPIMSGIALVAIVLSSVCGIWIIYGKKRIGKGI